MALPFADDFDPAFAVHPVLKVDTTSGVRDLSLEVGMKSLTQDREPAPAFGILDVWLHFLQLRTEKIIQCVSWARPLLVPGKVKSAAISRGFSTQSLCDSLQNSRLLPGIYRVFKKSLLLIYLFYSPYKKDVTA